MPAPASGRLRHATPVPAPVTPTPRHRTLNTYSLALGPIPSPLTGLTCRNRSPPLATLSLLRKGRGSRPARRRPVHPVAGAPGSVHRLRSLTVAFRMLMAFRMLTTLPKRAIPNPQSSIANRQSPYRRPQQFLYFFPLPQGQGELRPTLGPSRRMVSTFCSTPWARMAAN